METDEENEIRFNILNTYLPDLLPILLEWCRFVTADQIECLPSKDDELNIYTDKYYEDGEVEGVESVFEEDNYSKLESISTLRRASAFAFEHLAKSSPRVTFEWFGQSFENYLNSDDDQGKEAAILVLGAICEEGGCYDDVLPYCEKLMPLLFKNLENENLRTLITTWWTLSKFSQWMAQLDFEQIIIYMRSLLELMKHENSELRESVWSSLCELFAWCNEKLAPAINETIEILNQVLEGYSGNALLWWLDMISWMVRSWEPYFESQDRIESLFAPLTSKWNQTQNTDPILNQLFEWFKVIAETIKNKIVPYTIPLVQRWHEVIDENLSKLEDEQNNSGEKEFIFRSLQLLTALFNAVKGQMQGLVDIDSHIKLIGRWMESKDIMIKQYAFSHLGFALK